MIGPLARPAPAAGAGQRDRIQDRLELGAVVALPRGEDHAKRPAAAVAAQWILVVSPPRDRPSASTGSCATPFEVAADGPLAGAQQKMADESA
jgi:hypothetical protein